MKNHAKQEAATEEPTTVAPPDTQRELPANESGSITPELKEQTPPQGEQPSASATDLEQLRAERDSLLDRLARSQAEFENARKRMARDQQSYRELALTDVLKTLLPVLDSLDWALASPAQDLKEFHHGVRLIHNQLDEALKKLGVGRVHAEGEPFDPNLHEAVDVVETGAAADNQVLKELRRGYKLGNRLLRPAMVSVGRSQKS